MNEPLPQDRREFFRAALRAGVAGGFAAMGVWLAVRNRVCLRGGVCRNCSVYARCELPQKEKPR